MSEVDDYRNSHLDRGGDYDNIISGGPWDSYMANREKELLTEIVPVLFPTRAARYLDLACGTGRITQIVEPMVRESFGADISESMLERAREKCLRTTFLYRDLSRDPLQLPPFDLITAFRFFANAQDELRRSVISVAHQHLVPGGYFVLNNHRNSLAPQSILRALSLRERPEGLNYLKLNQMLAHAGFTTERIYGVGLWALRARWQTKTLLESPVADALELLSRWPLARVVSPDVVIVAKKR